MLSSVVPPCEVPTGSCDHRLAAQVFIFRLFKDCGQVKLPLSSISQDMLESLRLSFCCPF